MLFSFTDLIGKKNILFISVDDLKPMFNSYGHQDMITPNIDALAANKVNKAKEERKKICAVGTTVMRGLESSVSSSGFLNEFQGWTHKFIFPPYDFSIANSMITNFHTPKSTLLMMVSAFADPDFIKHSYNVAIKEKYNFYSYGDAMLIL